MEVCVHKTHRGHFSWTEQVVKYKNEIELPFMDLVYKYQIISLGEI